MFQRILVPLDGSALAEIVLPCVQELARLTGATVTLLQVIEPPIEAALDLSLPVVLGEATVGGALDPAARAEANAYLATVAHDLERAGLVASTQVVTGDPASQIIGASGDADLIVMATHGRSGIGCWAVGSVTDKVVRGASAPVMVVRANQTEIVATGHPRRILVPLDGSALAERALPLATALARQANASLLLVRSVTWPRDLGACLAALDPDGGAELLAHEEEWARDYLAALAARLTRQGVAVDTSLRYGEAAEMILATAIGGKADMIVMSTRGRGGLGRWVLGSVADRVLHAACAPVLLVRADAPAAGAAAAQPLVAAAAITRDTAAVS